jgi:hypothetical protein
MIPFEESAEVIKAYEAERRQRIQERKEREQAQN